MTDSLENANVQDAPQPARAQPGGARFMVEQAVFTSVPSPMGRGYRLVACSPGLTSDERREITQRSPSHGNLIDGGEEGTGLSSFGLRGGRRCVLCSWNAESEHTGRGGRRVHTQAAVLEPGIFDRFDNNPLSVAAAVADAVDPSLIPKPDAKLSPLELVLDAADGAEAGGDAPRDNPVSPDVVDNIIAIVAMLVGERRLLVTGSTDDAMTLTLVMELLPPALRRTVSVTCGLRFAPTRAAELVFTEARRDEIERIVRDHGYEWFAWGDAGEISLGEELVTWFGFLRKTWRLEGLGSLRRVYTRLGDASPATLRQIGRLLIDIERVHQTPADRLDALLEPHLPFQRHNDLQTALHLKLVQAVDARRRASQSLLPDCAITLP